MNQVHKENLTAIENALPNRVGLDVEIFGMEGIPEEIVQQHNQRVLTQFHQAEAERRAASGNPAPGAQNGNGPKKPKFESPADLKRRLAEHKAAKLAAEQNGGGSSGGNTPTPSSSQPITAQPSPQVASPAYPGYQQPYPAPPSASTFAAPQSYAQPGASAFGSPVYAAPPTGFSQSPPPQQPPYGQPGQQYQQPYAQPPFQQPFQAPNAFSPPPPFPGAPPFPNQNYQAQVPQNGFVGQVGAPRAYHSASPASPFPNQQRTHSPAQNGTKPGSTSLPAAPGLPQRPAVSAPQVNAAQFHQMHQGQIPTQHNFPPPQIQPEQSREEYNPAAPQIGMPRGLSADGAVSSIDDLISSASKQADETAARAKVSTPKPSTPLTATDGKEENADAKAPAKKEKESKDKANRPTRMVYSDNEISPEEKMAARYPFIRTQSTVHV